MEEKLIELYCTICQCNDSRFIEGKQRLSNNNCPKFSDEELITVYLWGKAQQLLTRKAIYNYTKSHLLAWFPALPSYQAFCRRLNRLTPAFQALAEIWAEDAAEKSGDTHCYAVDSCPVMAARRSYSTGARVGAEFCDKCYNAARQEWYYGVKLHVFVMLRPGRLPLLRAAQISPASCPDLLAAKQIDRDCAPVSFGHLFADRAYCDADWADSLKKCREIQIITPRKRKPYDVLRSGDCSHFRVSSARQPIESFFHWANLKSAFQDASRARSLLGIFFLVFSALAFIAFLARFYY